MAKKKPAKKAAKKATRAAKSSQWLVMARLSRDDIPLGLFGSKAGATKYVSGFPTEWDACDAAFAICDRLARTMLSHAAAGVTIQVIELSGGVPAKVAFERTF